MENGSRVTRSRAKQLEAESQVKSGMILRSSSRREGTSITVASVGVSVMGAQERIGDMVQDTQVCGVMNPVANAVNPSQNDSTTSTLPSPCSQNKSPIAPPRRVFEQLASLDVVDLNTVGRGDSRNSYEPSEKLYSVASELSPSRTESSDDEDGSNSSVSSPNSSGRVDGRPSPAQPEYSPISTASSKRSPLGDRSNTAQGTAQYQPASALQLTM